MSPSFGPTSEPTNLKLSKSFTVYDSNLYNKSIWSIDDIGLSFKSLYLDVEISDSALSQGQRVYIQVKGKNSSPLGDENSSPSIQCIATNTCNN